jgi:phosphomannomutase
MQHVQPLWDIMDKGRYLKKNDIDGQKRFYDDFSWLLIRPSGNEPAIRVYSEAMNPGRARELIIVGEKIVRRAVRSA